MFSFWKVQLIVLDRGQNSKGHLIIGVSPVNNCKPLLRTHTNAKMALKNRLWIFDLSFFAKYSNDTYKFYNLYEATRLFESSEVRPKFHFFKQNVSSSAFKIFCLFKISFDEKNVWRHWAWQMSFVYYWSDIYENDVISLRAMNFVCNWSDGTLWVVTSSVFVTRQSSCFFLCIQ